MVVMSSTVVLVFAVFLISSTVGNTAEIGQQFNRTFGVELDTGSTTNGPLGTMLNDISLRIQQHDLDQRLSAIQNLQQREQQQQLGLRQAEQQMELLQQIRQMQLNMTVEIQRLGRQQAEMYKKITEERDNGTTSFDVNDRVIVGCFKDTTDRDLPHEFIDSKTMTHQFCVKHCFEKGYRYAALGDGVHCFCGNDFGRHGSSNNCNTTCPGDHTGLTKCGGAWANTVIRIGYGSDKNGILMQQHFGGTNFFNKTWVEFKSEFGDVNGNYWIGNDQLHELTKDGRYRLRVDMLAKSNSRWYWAEYSTFRVYEESSGYTLNIGGYVGSAGDGLTYVNGRMFSAKDKDLDMSAINCTADGIRGNGGGFWYNDCGLTYPNSPSDGTRGFGWFQLPLGSNWSDRKLLVIRMTLIPK